jgi:hypothetical protein
VQRVLVILIFSSTLGACASAGAYPEYEGVDLDCADIGHSVRVEGADPHGLDADGDGLGCESW